jgi:CheY-like chemotaxis protein
VASTRYVAIALSDTGKGMSDAVMERAFEPFFTTKDAGRGTGLGLSTVYGFATQSGGTVALRSALGHGTTVTIYLPHVDAQVQEGLRRKGTATVPEGLRVIVVEDEVDVRAVAMNLVKALGCQAAACATAEEALALLAAGGDVRPFDLLLTDIALGPGMRGTEFARQVQGRWPDLPVLLMSGYSHDVLDQPPTWPLLSKPFNRDGLARAIAHALQ